MHFEPIEGKVDLDQESDALIPTPIAYRTQWYEKHTPSFLFKWKNDVPSLISFYVTCLQISKCTLYLFSNSFSHLIIITLSDLIVFFSYFTFIWFIKNIVHFHFYNATWNYDNFAHCAIVLLLDSKLCFMDSLEAHSELRSSSILVFI